MEKTVWGSLDLGSNTFRLLLARETAPGVVRETALHQEVVRAGEGLGREGPVSEGAFLRASACLQRFGRALDESGATYRFASLTAAGRDLEDGGRLKALAEKLLKAKVRIPSGEEEAGYSFEGALALAGVAAGEALLLDIGGGSTEAAFLKNQSLFAESLKLGVVRLTETLKPSDPVGCEGLETLVAHALKLFESSPLAGELKGMRKRLSEGSLRLVANAGTPLTLAALKLGLPLNDTRRFSGVKLTQEEVSREASRLALLTRQELSSLPAVARGREDVIVAGAAILLAFFRFTGAAAATVSDGGLAEGQLLSEVRALRGSARFED